MVLWLSPTNSFQDPLTDQGSQNPQSRSQRFTEMQEKIKAFEEQLLPSRKGMRRNKIAPKCITELKESL